MAQPAKSAETPKDLGQTASQCAAVCMACATTGHRGVGTARVLLDIPVPAVTKSSQSARDCSAPRIPSALKRCPPARACLDTVNKAMSVSLPVSHLLAPHWPDVQRPPRDRLSVTAQRITTAMGKCVCLRTHVSPTLVAAPETLPPVCTTGQERPTVYAYQVWKALTMTILRDAMPHANVVTNRPPVS